MWRDRSTAMPLVSDWPLVPVPPPRGAKAMALKRGSLDSLATRTTSSSLRGKTTACGAIW